MDKFPADFCHTYIKPNILDFQKEELYKKREQIYKKYINAIEQNKPHFEIDIHLCSTFCKEITINELFERFPYYMISYKPDFNSPYTSPTNKNESYGYYLIKID